MEADTRSVPPASGAPGSPVLTDPAAGAAASVGQASGDVAGALPAVVSVTVVHDPGEWFEAMLRSLAAQDYPSLRNLFLVAAGGDVAATTQRIRAVLPAAFVRDLPDNPGYGPAANEVLRLVEGDNGFFLFCHDDVALDQTAVSQLVTEIFRSNAGIVGPKLVDWDNPRLLQHVGLGLDRFGEVDPIVSPGEVDQEQHDAVRDVFVLPSACLLVRADLFRALGGFDPSISFHGDDVDLCWRAHLTGARVVVAPDARVRHRERLAERRPDLSHRALRSRHRMTTVATLTGTSRLASRSAQLVVLTLVELVVGLFTGRFGEAVASLRALIGLLPRSLRIARRRAAIRGQRAVPEREVLGLQDKGSSRLNSFLRGRETETFVGAESTVRRWREASFGPALAWFSVVMALVIGSRNFIRSGVPGVGEFLPFPSSPSVLLDGYRSAFDSRGFGATADTPTGWAIAAVLSVVTLFRMPLLMTVLVFGLAVLGALGAWRLSTVFPATRARIVGMIVYVATPLLPGLLHTGDLGGLVWYAGLPWLVHLVRRAAAIEAADPGAADLDLVDGVAATDVRPRLRAIAFGGLVLGAVAGFTPVAVVMFMACGVLLVLASAVSGARWRVSVWMLGATAAIGAIGFVLNAPWSFGWRWEQLAAAAGAGSTGRSVVEIATLDAGATTFAVLAVALYLPVVVAVAVSRAWRLTWSGRGAALVVGFGAALVASEHGFDGLPAPALLAAPIALGLALCAAALAGGFGSDVIGRGFGWRQPAAVLANVAIVVGVIPALTSIGDGGWRTPETPLTAFLDTQLPEDLAAGDYRVLYLGDPRTIPVPSHSFADGVGYAVVDAGPLDFRDRFTVAPTAGDAAVERALQLIADGSTLRVGRLLAPLGIRFVIVPETDGVRSTVDDPVPLASGLLSAIENQLDIGSIAGPPAFETFVNESWFPVGAQLVGPAAESSTLAGEDVLVRADYAGAVASMLGADSAPAGINEVAPGVVHVAIPFDERLELRVGDSVIEGRPGFGVTTAFDVETPGIGTLEYRPPPSRRAWLGVQLALWLAVVVAAAATHPSFARRRQGDLIDATLIDDDSVLIDLDLDPGSHEPARGVAEPGVHGEVLVTAQGGGRIALDHDRPVSDAALAFDAAGGAEPSRRAAPAVQGRPHQPAAARRPVRDTTPPMGIPIVARQQAGSTPDTDRDDLASLGSIGTGAESPDDQSPDDQSPDDQSPDDQSPDDQSPDDQSPDSQSPRVESPDGTVDPDGDRGVD